MKKLYLLFLAFAACNDPGNSYNSPPGYDLSNPEKFSLPDALNEVSGIGFYNGNNETLYAEQDEEGRVYYLHPGNKKANHTRFGKKGDYEDLAITNDYIVVLRSDGVLFSFPFSALKNEEASNVKEYHFLPKGEFEGLFAGKDNRLYVLCKQCNNDDADKAVSIYTLDLLPDGGITQNGSASLDVKPIQKITGKKKLKFQPSALAKQPQTGEWYMLSSVNSLLVIADSNWQVKEAYPLDKSIFRQPEGIAFDNQNNLYISNEGDDISKGNVLKFGYSK